MYNRYIPQSDGSYHRRTMQENRQPAQPPTPQHQSPPIPEEAPPVPISKHPRNGSVTGFLRQLLPKEFDTGDLLIVLLLLLMAGDCEDEKNDALLTLALYFFM